MPDGTATAHLYRPKLATTLREGYGLAALRTDAAAGLTVAIVALPLSRRRRFITRLHHCGPPEANANPLAFHFRRFP
jgi:hypothetical protein